VCSSDLTLHSVKFHCSRFGRNAKVNAAAIHTGTAYATAHLHATAARRGHGSTATNANG
jgi:hypothetical protein